MKGLGPIFPIMLATAFSAASAYTVSGTVKDESNKAIAGAEVTLLKEKKTVNTDNDGKFTLHEDEIPEGIGASATPGFININSGILSFSQSGSSPVNVTSVLRRGSP